MVKMQFHHSFTERLAYFSSLLYCLQLDCFLPASLFCRKTFSANNNIKKSLFSSYVMQQHTEYLYNQLAGEHGGFIPANNRL